MNETRTITDAIEAFLVRWKAYNVERYARLFPNLTAPNLSASYGQKYAKITDDHSVVAFVEIETGDIFKPASWKVPAKHARGNVYSDQQGMEAIGEQGCVRYLR